MCSNKYDDFFDKKSKNYWVLKDKAAFDAGIELIGEDGKWKANTVYPRYFSFCAKLSGDDLPILERWLSLEGLECFGVCNAKEQPNLRLINKIRMEMQKNSINLDKSVYRKLAWLNTETFADEAFKGKGALIPQTWMETNSKFLNLLINLP